LENLGHTISVAGSASKAGHTAAINACPPSGYQTIAMFPWHGKLLPKFFLGCARVLRPLTDLLKGGTKTLEWTAAGEEAFQSAKCLLAAVLPLQHPAPNAEFSLATDSSDSDIGCVMQQKSGDHQHPFDFFSKKLPPNLDTPPLIKNC
jgi:hypothetical protein